MSYDRRSETFLQRIDSGFTILLVLVLILWGVELLNLALGNSLFRFGILPRTIVGLRGILFSPFLHGSLGHMMANTIPFLVLGGLVMARGRSTFFTTTIIIALLGGTLVWLFGRPSFHIGASGLIFGYLGFLLAAAFFERAFVSILLAALATALYGGALFGLLPLIPGISWEGHLFGFLAGTVAAYVRTVAVRVT